MKKRLAALALLAAAATLPAATASAANDSSLPPALPGKPLFLVGPKHNIPAYHMAIAGSSAQIPQWNGSYTDLTKQTVNFTQVGGNPATTNTTSTIQVLLIPVKFVITQNGTATTFDPKAVKLANNHGRNVITAIKDSPLFRHNIDFAPQGGTCSPNCVDMGKTQYEDAFQRGTWWGNDVGANPSYHVLLTTKVEKEQTINYTCPKGQTCVEPNPFGGSGTVGIYPYGSMDPQLQTFMKLIKDVNPGVLPLFISYDVYLCQPCYVGGFHGADGAQPGGQTYAYATYVDTAGDFSQDVSAFSHELGEWYDDPFIDNYVNCNDNGLMEVGDPLENGPNFGAYVYKDKKFKYNLQSLVYMGYFGAPTTDSANQWLAFQDDKSNVCPGQ